MRSDIEAGLSRSELNRIMPPDPARNALDCALWDLEAKIENTSVSDLLGLAPPEPQITAYTLSLQSPMEMAEAAITARRYPLLKIKVNQNVAIECATRIIEARPDAKLIIDANEDLDREGLEALINVIPHKHIEMVEQPLAASKTIDIPLPSTPIICADESLHSEQDITQAGLETLWNAGYRAINVKLDKCGGLTAALLLIQMAKHMDFKIMAGCMVGSSLAMAPMVILSGLVDVLDLDGPLLLADDCENGLIYKGATLYPPKSDLWG